jgi:nicotinate-nucleotide adenylyltransferase
MTMKNDPTTARSIGLFGGTFDPIHTAHLMLAERAREELALDAILFMPARIPPHKAHLGGIAPPECRVTMIELAIESNPCFHLSRHEIEREGISYTVDTLRYLREAYPGAELTLLIGGDNAADFRNWREPQEIVRMAKIGVWARPSFALPEEVLIGTGYGRIEAPLMELSSTQIRARVALHRSIRYMTPDPVVEYIETNGLYRS